MAVFMVNICKFNGCGLTFPCLADLIQHIEDIHIDYDPRVIEQKELQQPACLPLSYVLRFFTDAARKEGHDVKRKLSQNHANKISPYALAATARSNTPTGSEADDDELMTESEDSNDSWTTSEEFSAEFILRYGSSVPVKKMPVYNSKKPQPLWMLNSSNNNNVDKPFACPVPGCKKRYKNVNGIKYHSKNGHKKDGKIRKGFKCHCGKSYKTCQGLRNHTTAHHSGANLTTLTTQNGEVVQIPTTHVAALQPFRAVALKQISTIGLPVKTIQGLVVATKPSEGVNMPKGAAGIDSNFDTITFAKGSTIQMAVPTLVSPPKVNSIAGLLVNNASATITQAVTAEPQTLTTTLGVLTPATSPQTPPPDSSRSVATTTPVTVTAASHNLPLTPVTPTTAVGIQLGFPSSTKVSSVSPVVGLAPNTETTGISQASV
ncbi:location of vulva defective 1 [Periplaneta americana]|uniref:location of vulva defective 1 n=1 Tax=Periplaneta americana TaxID=6978 RepID=UPI0037E90029